MTTFISKAMPHFDPTLYFITDHTPYSEADFLQRIEAALQGGVTLLQLREKSCSTKDYLYLANHVHALAQRYQVPLIIDDRIDVALAIDAEGVHLGRDDMPITIARKLMGNTKIIGATAKTVAQAQAAEAQGANYLGVGAIYPTTTKVKTVLTSVETLINICHNVKLPVNAIGGLTPHNLSILKKAPISGICVVSSIMHADDPTAATRALRAAIETELHFKRTPLS